VGQGEVDGFQTLGRHNMAASWLSCRKLLVGNGWATAFSFAQMGLENSFWPRRASISCN